jgi:hypothetical protein
MTKDEAIKLMLGLCPERELDQLREMTRELINYRDNPQMERSRFEGTKLRGITGFCSSLMPAWRRILVTGGTGCVGQVVLNNLTRDMPEAELWSLSRRGRRERQNLAAGAMYLRGDVRDRDRMMTVVDHVQPDLIVHLAAQRDPSYAESHIAETVTTNVYGTQVLLDVAGKLGVHAVVVASTGKAVRLFTSDVYAATKKLVEYEAAIAAAEYGMAVSCTRFTHVVDNSIVGTRLAHWIANGDPIELHSPHVLLPIQSALECYHLLMTAGIVADRTQPQTVALRDLGWPPVQLLDMTLDYLADAPESKCAILFTGYPAGYEAYAYPGTYDPLTAGSVSPLVNCIEAKVTAPTPVLGEWVDAFPQHTERCELLDEDLSVIHRATEAGFHNSEEVMGDLLRRASTSLLHRVLGLAGDGVTRIHKLGERHDPCVVDHRFIHERLHSYVSDLVTN